MWVFFVMKHFELITGANASVVCVCVCIDIWNNLAAEM